MPHAPITDSTPLRPRILVVECLTKRSMATISGESLTDAIGWEMPRYFGPRAVPLVSTHIDSGAPFTRIEWNH